MEAQQQVLRRRSHQDPLNTSVYSSIEQSCLVNHFFHAMQLFFDLHIGRE